MSSALSRRESISRMSTIGSTDIRGSMISRGHRSVSNIVSIDSMELRESSITSTSEASGSGVAVTAKCPAWGISVEGAATSTLLITTRPKRKNKRLQPNKRLRCGSRKPNKTQTGGGGRYSTKQLVRY